MELSQNDMALVMTGMYERRKSIHSILDDMSMYQYIDTLILEQELVRVNELYWAFCNATDVKLINRWGYSLTRGPL